MTLGPAELQQSGPELTWSQLRKSVKDDTHWNEDLVIHPDRVPTDELKSSHKYTPRIIAGILRHKATDYDPYPTQRSPTQSTSTSARFTIASTNTLVDSTSTIPTAH